MVARLTPAAALSFEELVTTTTRLWISSCVALAAACMASTAAAGTDPAGNPYSFYGSVGECAAAERDRCNACLADDACAPITHGADGNAECSQLGANDGRGYYLICVNLSLAIDAVASCAASHAPSCARDTRASESLAGLEANAAFLDNPVCAEPLDACLASLYGPSSGGFPGPGSGGGTSPPPRHTSIDCSDSCNDDANCDDAPDCELDGPSCDAESDTSCSDSSGDGGCSGDSSGDTGGGSCDSEDSCGGGSSSSCDSSDCGGGGDSDCGGGDGGGCSNSGGGDCSSGGGGGDCGGGGGGDCGGGGGGDCNVASRHGRGAASLPVAIAWALLPVPFAVMVRRRARRRRAVSATPAGPDREVAP